MDKQKKQEQEDGAFFEHESFLESLADQLVDAMSINAMEYGNTGDMLYN